MKLLKKILWVLFMIFCLISLSFYLDEFLFSKDKEVKEGVKEKNPKKKEYTLSLAMVGDALYHTGTYKDGYQSDGTYSFDYQLEQIKPIVEPFDLAYYNQESILGGDELGYSSYPTFNSPSAVGDAFVNAGFNLVSLANNHTLDKGTTGVLNSVAYWKEKDVVTAGSYASLEDRKIKINTKNNIDYAFLSYTTTTNGIKVPYGKDYLVDVYSFEKAKADIESVKDADVIFVAMHWGDEYTYEANAKQVEIATELSSLGVDVIIGAHPHVVQPIDKIGDTIVFYSLGNFISGQIGIERRVGLLASLKVNKVVENGKETVSISDINGELIYTSRTDSFTNYKVIPFRNLNNNTLYNYDSVKSKYEAIISKNNIDGVTVGKVD